MQDLAARNVLVDKDEVTKVADFGLSRETVEDVYEVTKVCYYCTHYSFLMSSLTTITLLL